MERIPIARLVRGQSKAVVYFDDWVDEIFDDNPIVPKEQSDYTIEGDETIVAEFEQFAESYRFPFGHHFPMPWSKACTLAHRFAVTQGINYNDILPEEVKAESQKERGKHITVY